MQPAHTEVYSSRRISKEGTVSSPFPPPGASHFLSNAALIKIDPFSPHRCSNRDTGDNNTPLSWNRHMPTGRRRRDHPWKEPSVVMAFIYSPLPYSLSPRSPHPVFKFTSQAIVFLAPLTNTRRLHEIKSLKCSMTASQVAAF